MTILPKPSPETSRKIPASKREVKASRQRTKHASSFLSFPPTSFFTGTCLLSSKAMGSWQPVLDESTEPDPKAPFSLTSQWAKAAQPRLSCCFLYAKPFLVLLSPDLINIPSESPGPLLWNLSHMKSRTRTLQLAPGRATQGQASIGNINGSIFNLVRFGYLKQTYTE